MAVWKLFLNRGCEQSDNDANGREANNGEDVAAKVRLLGCDGEDIEHWGRDDWKGHACTGGDVNGARGAGLATHGRAHGDAGE